MMRRTSIGISVSAGPSAATIAASTTVAAPSPVSDERQSRVMPAASTIVSASTNSTALARNADAMRKPAVTVPEAWRTLPGGALGVELFDHGREVLVHDLAAKLQRRRELTFLLREVAWQDREALDLLDAHPVAVDLVDDSLQERPRIGAGDLHLHRIEREQCRYVRPPVADDHGLRNEARRL